MMPTRLSYLAPLLSTMLFFHSCAPEPRQEENTSAEDVRLRCEQQSSAGPDAPDYAVYMLLGSQKTKLANFQACDSIPEIEYGQYDIPQSAIAAAGGWYAGAGDYLYVMEEDGAAVFYQGWADEAQEDEGFHYTQIAILENGRLKMSAGLSRDEVVGTYALSRQVGSHLVFVGMRGDTLIGEHFQLDGILPPVNQLNLLMTGLTPLDSAALQLSEPSMQFASPMGNGRFERGPQQVRMLLNLHGQPLYLEKIGSEAYSPPAG